MYHTVVVLSFPLSKFAFNFCMQVKVYECLTNVCKYIWMKGNVCHKKLKQWQFHLPFV